MESYNRLCCNGNLFLFWEQSEIRLIYKTLSIIALLVRYGILEKDKVSLKVKVFFEKRKIKVIYIWIMLIAVYYGTVSLMDLLHG